MCIVGAFSLITFHCLTFPLLFLAASFLVPTNQPLCDEEYWLSAGQGVGSHITLASGHTVEGSHGQDQTVGIP